MHYALGVAYCHEGDKAQCKAELRRTLELQPSNAQAHAYLGGILLQEQNASEAVIQLEAAAPQLAAASGCACSIRARLS